MNKFNFVLAIVFFMMGGFGYGLMEVVVRGYTHPSMFLAGGICFVTISKIAVLERIGFIAKCLLSATVITLVEFLFGYIFNIVLKMNVWDYSNQPFNIMGQVCPKFFAIWLVLSAGAIIACRYIIKSRKKLLKI